MKPNAHKHKLHGTKMLKRKGKELAYRNCVAVCASEELSAKIQELLQGKSRDEIFELPFVYGQTIHYVPDGEALGKTLEMPVWELIW